ncbi:zf-TFIIB domain-containing protein [Algiphilus sp.]|uniref:TFIIB-type zinc ribbon-containing protein n=1 Tax=Algiphilus sp. TaxID=1872431 RepID=UPI003B521621
MKCPIDEEMLVMTERNGVEIDYCPKCRGVWLDRGELDKIIERAADTPPPTSRGASGHDDRGRDASHRSDTDYRHGGDYRKRKKHSLLGELFDF